MRSQKSRSRGKNRNNNRSNVNIVNRVFDSSGPEGKVRGTPQQIIEKYNQLHRDAQLSGDRVAAENFQQHAEHYARMLGDALKEQEAKREAQEAQQAANRERQQREREEREAQRAAQGAGQPQPEGEAQPQPQPQPQANERPRKERKPRKKDDGDRDGLDRMLGSGDQPDVIDLSDDETESGLVETVEAAPKPARKPRARKPKSAADDSAAAE
ncbi:MAG: DUF4167 domain-containing protein [Pseudomonadota bacterium]